MSCGYVEVNKIEFTGLVIQIFMILNMFLINYFQGCHTSDGFGYFGMIWHFSCDKVEGGGGAMMRKCWKDKLSLQSQFLSLTSLLIRFQTKEEILRGLPTAMAMMRKLNGGLLKQRQRAYGGTNLSLEPKKKQKLCQDHAGVPEPRRWSQQQRSEQWSDIHSR